jgi:phosphoglycerol transferase MdoB-like AlkP superfamily enzyme
MSSLIFVRSAMPIALGPYIGAAAVADKVAALLQEASGPVFIFAITMENHGPLHLEHVAPNDIEALYSAPPPQGCDDLTVYLRHLRNADAMVASLRATLERCDRPAALCRFGDHVPILPAVYLQFETPEGEVEYVFWSNQNAGAVKVRNLSAENLSSDWLRAAGVMD